MHSTSVISAISSANCKMTIFLFSIVLLSCIPPDSSEPTPFYLLPGVNQNIYSQLGDINIGALSITLKNSNSPAETCSDDVEETPYTLETVESIAFAVDYVNRNPNLLPNITLGFVVRGVCSNSPGVALATSVSFLPRNNSHVLMSSDSGWLSHDVIGLVTPGTDSLTTMISSLFSVAHLPMIGTTEVSDELSNKDNHPYFFRLIPPNKPMVIGMLGFAQTFHWSYISVIYRDGPYGQASFENVQQDADRFGICIATSHRLVDSTNYDEVVDNLLLYPRARVVFLFVVGSEFRKILKAVKSHNATGHFVFIASDSITDYTGYDDVVRVDDEGIGTIVFDHFFRWKLAFYDYLKNQRVKSTKNPWLKAPLQYILQCSFDEGNCTSEKEIFEQFRYNTSKTPNLRVDAVFTFAHAAHRLLSEKCPNARGQEARACINGPVLRDYLKNVTIRENNYEVKFDENQEFAVRFLVNQLVVERYRYPFTGVLDRKHIISRNVGLWSVGKNVFVPIKDTRGEPTDWSHVNTLDRIVPWTKDSLSIEIPESVCSRPCLEGEYKIVKDLPCCWECQRCRENERLVQGNTSCEACPQFTWPDPLYGLTTCIDIQPTYPTINETIPIVLVIFAVLFVLVTFSIFVCYVIYRNERVIKASSRELSVIQLVAIFLGYTTIILFQTKPTDIMCGVIFVAFCVSFALLYCPMLVKTVRIVQIFRSDVKNKQQRFISVLPRVIFTLGLILVQVFLCISTYLLFWPKARLSQPIWSEKMVELSCDLTLPGLASFLGYNIMLISLCSIFAYKVRTMPDNFNETKFISMFVSTTLLIWLAFIPTYFTADKEYLRGFLLCMALFLNHSVALIFLFMPKMYAVIVLPSNGENLSDK